MNMAKDTSPPQNTKVSGFKQSMKLVILALAIICGILVIQTFRANRTKPETFEQHRQTCPECGQDNPNVPLCERGFELMKEALKNE